MSDRAIHQPDAETKHGFWCVEEETHPYCSVCGGYRRSERYNYCPWCGAKMDADNRASE